MARRRAGVGAASTGDDAESDHRAGAAGASPAAVPAAPAAFVPTDPVSGMPLGAGVVFVPNRALAEAVAHFLRRQAAARRSASDAVASAFDALRRRASAAAVAGTSQAGR
jgi:hypothetical protein